MSLQTSRENVSAGILPPMYRDVFVLPRRDGIVVQAIEGGDLKGYNDINETPDRAESERAVAVIATPQAVR